MPVVVDASLVVALISKDPRGDAVSSWLRRARLRGESLHAPELLVYEAASALTRLLKASQMSQRELRLAWSVLEDLPVILHAERQGVRIVEIALRLNRTSAYDAAYLALTEELGAELWTLDVPLMRNASALGFNVVVVGQPVE